MTVLTVLGVEATFWLLARHPVLKRLRDMSTLAARSRATSTALAAIAEALKHFDGAIERPSRRCAWRTHWVGEDKVDDG